MRNGAGQAAGEHEGGKASARAAWQWRHGAAAVGGAQWPRARGVQAGGAAQRGLPHAHDSWPAAGFPAQGMASLRPCCYMALHITSCALVLCLCIHAACVVLIVHRSGLNRMAHDSRKHFCLPPTLVMTGCMQCPDL